MTTIERQQVELNDGFNDQAELSLYESTVDKESGLAGFRTKEAGDAGIVQNTGRKSNHTIVVRRLVAIDGLESTPATGSADQRMSLLILDYSLKTATQFAGVRTQFVFSDLDETKTEYLSNPRVVAFAPFSTSDMHWHPSVEEQKVIQAFNGKLGGGVAGFTASVEAPRTHETSKKMPFSGRGYAERIYTEEEPYYANGIEWILQQNESISTGIPNYVRVAILLERDSDAPIQISYELQCQINFWSNFKNSILSLFDLGQNRRVNIRYKPHNTSRAFEVGKEIRDQLEHEGIQTRLGDLRKQEKLVALSLVEGLRPVQLES